MARRLLSTITNSPSNSEFRIDMFGSFNGVEIRSIIDRLDRHWFPANVVADALDMDRSTITKARENHPTEFSEGEEYDYFPFEGKRHLCFSEEGFMRILDAANSERAMRLRRWIRQQFRVRQEGTDIVVRARSIPQDEPEEIDDDLALVQNLLNSVVEDRRRIKRLERQSEEMKEEAQMLAGRVANTENKLAIWEENAKLQPGELTAIMVASRCKWQSSSGAPHNVAVIAAAANQGLIARNLLVKRKEQVAGGRIVDVYVFTPEGVVEFITRIDSQYSSGQKFTISANKNANTYHGIKGNFYVYKA
jgi:prophage antirepressor-like protein